MAREVNDDAVKEAEDGDDYAWARLERDDVNVEPEDEDDANVNVDVVAHEDADR